MSTYQRSSLSGLLDREYKTSKYYIQLIIVSLFIVLVIIHFLWTKYSVNTDTGHINICNELAIVYSHISWVCILEFMMYIVHWILYTLYCTMYIVQCILYTIHYTLYTIQCTLYILHCTQYTVYYILYYVHYILYSVLYALYTVQCTVYSVQYILHSVHGVLMV